MPHVIALMPRKRKPYVLLEHSRHGTPVWYFRRGKGKRIRLPGAYESPEWLEAYTRAMGGQEVPRAVTASGTLDWLITRYFDSLAFATLAPNTQRARRSVLTRVAKNAGHLRLAQITAKRIAESRDARSATPTAAVTFVKYMKGLFAWAVKAGHMTSNPAAAVDSKAVKTDGHHTWTVDEVRQFWKRHPRGTMARLALDIMLYTGMRRSDAVLFSRQHVHGDVIEYRQGKTRAEIAMPLLPPLKRSMDAMPKSGKLHFLLTAKGEPFSTSNSFGNWFAKRCIEAKVPGRAHGLRKAGATFAANNGASDKQLMAMWGWEDPKQAAVYTRRANRAVLAQAAAAHLDLDEE